MTQPPPLHPCLLHAEYHPMGDACLAAVVAHSRRHPKPFTRAAWDDYHLEVEQAMLDLHIRQHLSTLEAPVPMCDPEGERVPVPQDEDLEQAA